MHSRFLLTITSLVVCAASQAQIVVANGASYRQDQPVSPGSIAVVAGTFTGETLTPAPGFPLPTTINGVRVLINELEAPLFYVSAGQIGIQVPSSLAPGRYAVRVITSGGEQTGKVTVIPAAPGIFLLLPGDVQPPQGAILNQDNSVNGAGNPAARGSVIQIYATGPGGLSQPVPDGSPAGTSPLVTTKSKPVVYIGGVESQVDFSGMVGAPGLWQINARVPDRPFVSGQVAVQIFIDGVDSNEVSLFVTP